MERKTTIQAGGGIVIDPSGRILMIFRRGYWDLPKGKWESGETIEQCAVREVEEECGVSGLEITQNAGTTEHLYQQDGVTILKRTHWFLMRGLGETPTPQTEEDIQQAQWVPRQALPHHLAGAYPTIQTLLKGLFGL